MTQTPNQFRNATSHGSICTQFAKTPLPIPGFTPIPAESEDCLHLNIWRPTSPRNLPILVFIPGGAFIAGGASVPMYNDFPRLAENAILINISHRVGPMGFLAHPALSATDPNRSSGNYLYSDILNALRWVQKNAVKLGGDPSKVLLFGQSSGAAGVLGMVTSPLAKGLFTSAIIQSGPFFYPKIRPRPLKELEAFGLEFARLLGCDHPDAQVTARCLRDVPTQTIVDTWLNSAIDGAVTLNGHESGLPIDGRYLTQNFNDAFRSGRFNKVPMIFGSTNVEVPSISYLFSLFPWNKLFRDLISISKNLGVKRPEKVTSFYNSSKYPRADAAKQDFQTDTEFRCHVYPIGKAIADHGVEVKAYDFNYAPSYLPLPMHGSELALLFGTGSVRLSDRDEQVGRAMRDAWVAFANSKGRVTGRDWPRFDQKYWMEFSAHPKIKRFFRKEPCEFFASQGVY